MSNFWFDYSEVNFPENKDSKKKIYIPNEKPVKFYRIYVKKEDKNNEEERCHDNFGFNTVSDKDLAKDKYADYIVNEIIRLKSMDNAKKDGKDYNIKFSDMCILVRTNAEGDYIEKKFNKYKIPYTHYKKKGLFNSTEGNEFYYLLRALAYPFEKKYEPYLYLTRFFHHYSVFENGITDKIRTETENILDKWRNYFEEYGFYYMTEKIFSEKIGSAGRSFFEYCMDFENNDFSDSPFVPNSGERTIANFKQIVKKLNDKSLENKTLTDYFECLKSIKETDAEEENFQEKETERDLVQIMTMHASKGLEFPIVFIFGGWSQVSRLIGLKSVISGNHKIYSFDKVFSRDVDGFIKDDSIDIIRQKEDFEEYKRLIYVAFTRAKTLLYIPYLMMDGIDAKSPALARIAHGMRDIVEWQMTRHFSCPDICNNCKSSPYLVVDYYKNQSVPSKYRSSSADVSGVKSVKIHRPDDIKSHREDMRQDDSFSSLKEEELDKKGIVVNPKSQEGKAWGKVFSEPQKTDFIVYDKKILEQIEEITDFSQVFSCKNFAEFNNYANKTLKSQIETILSQNFADISERDKYAECIWQKSQELLPKGKNYGEFYHQIFEDIKFEDIMAEKSFDDWYKKQTSESKENYAIYSLCRKKGLNNKASYSKILKMVWNTLHLCLPGTDKMIGDITSEKCRKELNFSSYYEKDGKKNYVSGIIDMVFEIDGKIYILDWKSNVDEDGDYREESLKKQMEEHNYGLQWTMYSDAVNKWFEKNGYNTAVSGVYYVFLRPSEIIKPVENEKISDGIYYCDLV